MNKVEVFYYETNVENPVVLHRMLLTREHPIDVLSNAPNDANYVIIKQVGEATLFCSLKEYEDMYVHCKV